MLADGLFRPSERDLVTVDAAPRRLAFFSQSLIASASIIINSPVVPGDEVWQITGVGLELTPGAAQTALVGAVRTTQLPNMTVSTILFLGGLDVTGTAAASQGRAQACDHVLMPGEIVQFQGAFNAGAAANTVTGYFHGIAIPRGNMLK